MDKASVLGMECLSLPAVAHTFGCQKENVERSIRTAMDYAWEKGDHELWCRYFPDSGQRPTNAVFISRITEALLLEDVMPMLLFQRKRKDCH